MFLFGFIIRYYSYEKLVKPFMDDENGFLTWYKWIYYPTYNRLDGLLAGVSIAALFTFRPLLKKRICKYGNLLLLLSLVIITASYFLCRYQGSFGASIFGFPLISIGYGIMVMGAVSPGSFLYTFKSRTTTVVATLSYAIYLTHKIVIHITQDQFEKIGVNVNGNLMFIICIVTSVLGAFLLNKVVEKPFLKLREKILEVL